VKTGGARGSLIKPLVEALESAGFELSRRSTSHFIFKAAGKQPLTIPQLLDDPRLARRLAKLAGVSLG
jgi:hypothetical protein